MTNQPLLTVSGLNTSVSHQGEEVSILKNISFELYPGTITGIVGATGSGKTTLAMSVLNLLPRRGNMNVRGNISFRTAEGDWLDLTASDEVTLQAVRGREIGMVFQDPDASLNPLLTCGAQLMEAIRAHLSIRQPEAKDRAISLLKEMEIDDPERIFNSWPHQISGGQKQRVMIAIAMACQPSLIIADEPATALDVTTQKTILDLLRSLKDRHSTALLYISHDLGAVSEIADEMIVLDQGVLVERGRTHKLMTAPDHAVTRRLLRSRPPLHRKLYRLPESDSDEITGSKVPPPDHHAKTLISLSDVNVYHDNFHALRDISFSIRQGESVGIAGGSGSGKTTLARLIAGLIHPDSGSVVKGFDENRSRRTAPPVQLVFQHPYASLNPAITVGSAIQEPLRLYNKNMSHAECSKKVIALLHQVDLGAEFYNRYPATLSGGQRQRVCIARALATNPSLLVLDEPVSSLDVFTQARVLNLLTRLREELSLTFIFISHDISVIRFICDRMIVLDNGRIVESGPVDQVIARPEAQYTKRLIEAVPSKYQA